MAGFDTSGLISRLPRLDPPVLAWRRTLHVVGGSASLSCRTTDPSGVPHGVDRAALSALLEEPSVVGAAYLHVTTSLARLGRRVAAPGEDAQPEVLSLSIERLYTANYILERQRDDLSSVSEFRIIPSRSRGGGEGADTAITLDLPHRVVRLLRTGQPSVLEWTQQGGGP